MTEDQARLWFLERYSSGTIAKLDAFVALLRVEAENQSLIARSTFDTIWSRHLFDSAQLAALGDRDGAWLDIGSGGGLPGLVLAILQPTAITLAEPRKLRVDFLRKAADALALQNVSIFKGKVQNLTGDFQVVTARAVAPVADLFAWTRHLVSRETQYLLPRGRSASDELANARRAWHGTFHVEPSLSYSESGIVVATQVRAR